MTMKTVNKIIILLVAAFMAVGITAQTRDARQRSAETIVADGLAQLPAQDVNVFNQVMGEIAGTGANGVKMIADMMVPADKGKNAAFEYAVNGLVDYVMKPGNESLRDGIRQGLVAGIENCKDNTNKAFLMSQLSKCATAAEAGEFVKYIDNSYLGDFALRGLTVTPGTDDVITALMDKASTDKMKGALAHAVDFKKMSAAKVETKLLYWANTVTDASALSSIYDALATCGTASSINVLKKAAKNVKFNDDATGATDAYLKLLSNVAGGSQAKEAAKAATELLKDKNVPVRCAALQTLLKCEGSKGSGLVLAALDDNDPEYRNAALNYASQYIGKDIYEKVCKKLPKLKPYAQADVISWLGNSYTKTIGAIPSETMIPAAQIDAVVAATKSADGQVVKAAIEAAGKLGGDKALEAVTALLDSKYSTEASNALLSFNGNINDRVIKALDGSDNAKVNALNLVATRHMTDAYDKVVSLTGSGSATVRNAALNALAGVVTPANFNAMCDMLEKSDASNVAPLQLAAEKAIHAESADKQYQLIAERLAKTSNEGLYCPLLAQAGNAEAIAKLKQLYANPTYSNAAFGSLLNVDNDLMIDQLYNIAATNESQRDEVIGRFITLVQKSKLNDIEKYQQYSRILQLNPSTNSQKAVVNALADVPNFPSLSLVSGYLDNQATALSAALAVKSILVKNNDLMQGEKVKDVMKKAQDVFRVQSDADSHYAVDEINTLLPKVGADGFESLTGSRGKSVKSFKTAKNYENFELYLDWKNMENSVLDLRSMPQVVLNSALGVSVISADTAKDASPQIAKVLPPSASGEWNTLYVKVVNDRLLVESNGVKIAENVVIKNTPAAKPINNEGLVELLAKGSNAEIANAYIRTLPPTPVFTLSPEEKKQGFKVLFDGRSLENWQGNMTNYVPVDGNIYVTAQYGGSGNLYTKKKYSDFIYRFEFCFAVDGVNNGIGIRTKLGVDAAYDGMEIQVLDHDSPIYKGLHPYQQHGSVYGVIVPKHVVFGPLGTWNTEEIRAVGDHITVTVNGVVINDGNIREACKGHNVAPDGSDNNPYTVDNRNHPGLFNKDGYISFCGHGAGVKFRNIRILDLSKEKKNGKKAK
jgi:hypothetical protein